MAKINDLSKRFYIVILGVFVICLLIVWRTAKTVFIERSLWLERVEGLVRENMQVPALRGNIYAQDGRLMASSIPRYKTFIDFKADGMKLDTLKHHLPVISQLLANEFGERSASGWSSHLLRGYKSRSRHYRLVRRSLSYTEMKRLKTMPFFSKSPNACGLILETVAQRAKPFGLLASRTVGDVYGEQNKGGKNGLELAFDSLLRGEPGVGRRQKVAGYYRTIVEQEPVNGHDITTTIDIDIQDITHTALLEKLTEIQAESGCAIVMEVETGKIKAISNLGRSSQGHYYEMQNYAFADISEPGSTFKVPSMMVALDNGKVLPGDTVDTGAGLFMYKGARMTDHNRHKGGYGKITAEQSIWYSSNIGVAKIILNAYERNPSEYVDALYEMGLLRTFDCHIPGAGTPRIRHPKDTTAAYWSKTTLPWMSFGYETQIPPIYILNFYNAIANDGKMMRPYLIENIKCDTEIVQEMEPDVLQSRIAKRSTIQTIQKMLEGVVTHGTASMIHSTRLKLAGKTGTAQIAQGKSGYRGAGKTHQVSFCGYFPADNPKYSCIVVVRNPRIGYPSGGGMSGMVFKHIAERTYAQSTYIEAIERDTNTVFIPQVKNGHYAELMTVLNQIDVDSEEDGKDWKWTTVGEPEAQAVPLLEQTFVENLVPPVYGMGAKDAVYLLESKGLRVQINGSGSVYRQSKRAGSRYRKGETVVIHLR